MHDLITIDDFKEEHASTPRSDFLKTFTEPFLKLAMPGDEGRILPLPPKDRNEKLSIGSGADCDLSLEAAELAEVHCKIFYHAILKEWCLADQGTDAGTLVDGVKVAPFAVCSLHEDTVARAGELEISLLPLESIEEMLYPGARTGSTTKVKRNEIVPDIPAARIRKTEDLADVRGFLKAFLGPTAQPIRRLESRLDEEGPMEFLQDFKMTVLVLLSVVVQRTKPPVYKYDELPTDHIVFWPVGPEGRAGTYTIGRSDAADVLIRAKVISKEHCEIACDGDNWTIRDLGSVNGLFIEDERIETSTPQLLKSSSRLRISPHIGIQFLRPFELVNFLEGLKSSRR